MAKKKTNKAKAGTFKLNLSAIVAIIVGLATYGLAFLPATKIVYLAGTKLENVQSLNFYNLIKDAFAAEEVIASYLIMAIATLIALICAGLLVVAGAVWLFNLLKGKESFIVLGIYALMFIAVLTVMICFFVWRADILTTETILGTLTKDTPVSTFVYFLLGIDVVGIAAHLLLPRLVK